MTDESNSIFNNADPVSRQRDLIAYLDNIRDIAVQGRQPFDLEWSENLRFYLSDQQNAANVRKKAFWRSASVSNVIFPAVEQVHALMTDERSIPYATRRAGGTQRMQNILTDQIEQIWENNQVEVQNSFSVKDSLIFGTGIFKTTYDKKKKSKRTPIPIIIKRIDTRDFYIDPIARGIEDARYIIERQIVGISDLIERHPDKFKEIISSDHSDFRGVFDRTNKRIIREKRINVWEAWFTDVSRIVSFSTEPKEGTKEVEEAKRKFPNGRRVLFIGDVILEDEKNPYPWFPYSAAPLTYIPDEFWGLSLVTNLKMLQQQRNDIRDMLFDNLKSNINSIFKMTEGAADLDEIVPVPGTVISLRGEGAVFERVQGVSLPSEAFNMDSLISEEMLRLSGINEATFGATVGSSRPGTVQAQFNASLTRMREYLRLRNNMILEDTGRKCIWMIQNFVSADTVISVSNPDNDVSSLKDEDNMQIIADVLSTERVQGEASRRNVTLNETNPDFGRNLEGLTSPDEEQGVFGVSDKEARAILIKNGIDEFKKGTNVKEGTYDFKVDIHPVQIRDRQSLFDFIISLLQFGVADPAQGKPGFVDEEFVWENLPLPGSERLVRRIRKQKEEFRRAQQEQLELQRRQVEAQEAQVAQSQQPQQPQQQIRPTG